MKRGLLLFAHGSRDPAWAEPLHALAAQLQLAYPEAHVGLAFLEFMTPDLADSVAQAAAAGVQSLTVLPMFIAAGGHVLHDLPLRVAQLQPVHPAMQISVAPPVGVLAEVQRAMTAAAGRLLNP